MRYYFYTEFHEYKKKPLFGKHANTVELISIGIVSEDVCDIGANQCDKEWSKCNLCSRYNSREYYAICKDFDLRSAWNVNQRTKEDPNYWLRENNAHNALDDAKWNKKLHKFLNKL